MSPCYCYLRRDRQIGGKGGRDRTSGSDSYSGRNWVGLGGGWLSAVAARVVLIGLIAILAFPQRLQAAVDAATQIPGTKWTQAHAAIQPQLQQQQHCGPGLAFRHEQQ